MLVCKNLKVNKSDVNVFEFANLMLNVGPLFIEGLNLILGMFALALWN